MKNLFRMALAIMLTMSYGYASYTYNDGEATYRVVSNGKKIVVYSSNGGKYKIPSTGRMIINGVDYTADGAKRIGHMRGTLMSYDKDSHIFQGLPKSELSTKDSILVKDMNQSLASKSKMTTSKEINRFLNDALPINKNIGNTKLIGKNLASGFSKETRLNESPYFNSNKNSHLPSFVRPGLQKPTLPFGPRMNIPYLASRTTAPFSPIWQTPARRTSFTLPAMRSAFNKMSPVWRHLPINGPTIRSGNAFMGQKLSNYRLPAFALSPQQRQLKALFPHLPLGPLNALNKGRGY